MENHWHICTEGLEKDVIFRSNRAKSRLAKLQDKAGTAALPDRLAGQLLQQVASNVTEPFPTRKHAHCMKTSPAGHTGSGFYTVRFYLYT